MLKVKFMFDKMVTYWSSEHGANCRVDGTFVNSHWHNDASYMDKVVKIQSVEEVQDALKNILDYNNLPTDYFAIMEDGRVTFNTIEDGESNVVEDDKAEEDAGAQLYICDYSVNIEIQEVYEPSVDQLKEMFPNADY